MFWYYVYCHLFLLVNISHLTGKHFPRFWSNFSPFVFSLQSLAKFSPALPPSLILPLFHTFFTSSACNSPLRPARDLELRLTLRLKTETDKWLAEKEQLEYQSVRWVPPRSEQIAPRGLLTQIEDGPGLFAGGGTKCKCIFMHFFAFSDFHFVVHFLFPPFFCNCFRFRVSFDFQGVPPFCIHSICCMCSPITFKNFAPFGFFSVPLFRTPFPQNLHVFFFESRVCPLYQVYGWAALAASASLLSIPAGTWPEHHFFLCSIEFSTLAYTRHSQRRIWVIWNVQNGMNMRSPYFLQQIFYRWYFGH